MLNHNMKTAILLLFTTLLTIACSDMRPALSRDPGSEAHQLQPQTFLVPLAKVELRPDISSTGTEFTVKAVVTGMNRPVVRFLVDGVLFKTIESAPYCLFGMAGGLCERDRLPADGPHIIRAEVHDLQGEGRASAEIKVVQNPPVAPRLSHQILGNPAGGSWSVRVDYAGVAGTPSLRFYVNGSLFSTASAPPYCLFGAAGADCVLDRLPVDGSHLIRVDLVSGGNVVATRNINLNQTPLAVKVKRLPLILEGPPNYRTEYSYKVYAKESQGSTSIRFFDTSGTLIRTETQSPFCLFGKQSGHCAYGKLGENKHHVIRAEEVDSSGNIVARGTIEFEQGPGHCFLQLHPNQIEEGDLVDLNWASLFNIYSPGPATIHPLGAVDSHWGVMMLAPKATTRYRATFTENGQTRTCNNLVQVLPKPADVIQVERYTHSQIVNLEPSSRYKIRIWGPGGNSCSAAVPGGCTQGSDTVLQIPGRPSSLIAGAGGVGRENRKPGAGGLASGGDVNIPGRPGLSEPARGGHAPGLGGLGGRAGGESIHGERGQFPGGGGGGQTLAGGYSVQAGGGSGGYVEATIETGPAGLAVNLTIGRTSPRGAPGGDGLAEFEKVGAATKYKDCETLDGSVPHGTTFRSYYRRKVTGSAVCGAELRRCNHGYATRSPGRQGTDMYLSCGP